MFRFGRWLLLGTNIFLLLLTTWALMSWTSQGIPYSGASLRYVFYSTFITFAFQYVTTSILLKARGLPDLEVMGVSLAMLVSSMWLYELIYHYSFPVYFNYFSYPFDFNDLYTPIFAGGLALLLVVAHQHLKIRGNRLFYASAGLFVILWAIWLAIGFPQYFEQRTYITPLIQLEDAVDYSFPFNAATKASLSITYISLLAPTQKDIRSITRLRPKAV